MIILGGVCLTVFACGATGAISGGDPPMTLASLYTSLGIPSDCGSAATWEGKTVSIQGYVDQDNIFDKQGFPNLPYEKFVVTDKKGKTMEVWVKAPDSRKIFSRVHAIKDSPIIVWGRLATVKMPVKGKCQIGAKVWIDDPSHIQ